MRNSCVTFAASFLAWLIFSGVFEPFYLIGGAASCALSVLLARQMGILDERRLPLYVRPRMALYCFWLLKEMLLASFDVSRRVWRWKPAISPALASIRANQRGEAGRVVYANSITLTPGTVCVDMQGDQLKVHALAAEGISALREGEMDRRVMRATGW